jgi:SAM-dependent methyltransferase
MLQSNYSDSFQAPQMVAEYENIIFSPDSFDSYLWSIQRQRLKKILAQAAASTAPPLRSLDFACGTGRILEVLEEYSAPIGIDVSAEMLLRAKSRVVSSELRCGELTRVATENDWDVITAFRFFLNTEPEVRSEVMSALAQRLKPETGRLIFNVHGNRNSLRRFSLAWHRIRGLPGPVNDLSRTQIVRMTKNAGLEILSWSATGFFPQVVHRIFPFSAFRLIDRAFTMLLPWFGIDLMFICARPCGDDRCPSQAEAA